MLEYEKCIFCISVKNSVNYTTVSNNVSLNPLYNEAQNHL